MDSLDGTETSPRSHSAWLDMERVEKVPEIVARRILNQIVEQDMEAGDRLPPEAAMLQTLGVGRASLREALRILETHGLIRIKPGPKGGPIVTQPTAGDYGHTTTLYLHRSKATFAELGEARLVMEPVMARLAAERINDERADRLREVMEASWAAIDADASTWSATSEAFHSMIGAASGNRVLDLYAGGLVAIERNRLGPLFTSAKERRATVKVHQRIADAILEGDGDAAHDLSGRHIRALQKVWQSEYARRMHAVIEWE